MPGNAKASRKLNKVESGTYRQLQLMNAENKLISRSVKKRLLQTWQCSLEMMQWGFFQFSRKAIN
jgi:hypothetical protein